MKARSLALAPLLLSAACAAHRPTTSARGGPGGGVIIGQASPATAWSQPVAGPLMAPPLAVSPLAAALKGTPVEPLGCPIYGGDDRPDYDAQGLQCIVEWIRASQDYLARGGAPTKYTNAATLEQYRGFARVLQARLDAFVSGARWEASALPRPTVDAGPAAEAVAESSQQAFLSGMILFQKGDYINARAKWTLAVQLDAANVDAKDGLARLDRIEGR